ncbi:10941_t:CDS:2, partial [Entrophospora sp. SA101]
YKKKTGLDPWINSKPSESSQIENADNYLSHDCVIKISKFLEEKGIIHETVHKRFPFLSYTNSNAWHRDVFKYTDSEAKFIIAKLSLPEIQVSMSNKTQSPIPRTHPNKIYQPEVGLRQYAIEHGMDPEKFSVITKAEKDRWTIGYRDRLIGEELLHRSILKSGLSTAWLDDLMKEWEEIHTQF